MSTYSAVVVPVTERCLFCADEIENQGLGFYDHVDTSPSCDFMWESWMDEIPKDHGGA